MYMCQRCGCGMYRDYPVKYCSYKCRHYKVLKFIKPKYEKTCYRCNETFYPAGMHTDEICKKCASTIDEKYFLKIPIKNYYVYEWLDYDRVFYVGKGSNNRAIAIHDLEAQDRRICTNGFYVRIIEHGLTEEYAYFLESKLIKIRRMEKCHLANINQTYASLGQTSEECEKEELFFTF